MDPAELESAVAQHLRAIQQTAAQSPAGGGDAWDAMLRHYGVAPLDAHERRMIVEHMKLPRGAVPAEVRMLIASLEAWAKGQLAGLASPGADQARQRLDGFVDREIAAYERALGLAPLPPLPPPTPAAPSLGSIFANAQQTAKETPWANMKYKNVGTLTCVHCGGPQQQPQDFMCRYCRRPIAGAIKPTA